ARSTVSDARGRFQIDQLAPGNYRFSAVSRSWRGGGPDIVRLGLAEHEHDVTIPLDPATTVEGRVRIESIGAPCATGYVTLSAPAASGTNLMPGVAAHLSPSSAQTRETAPVTNTVGAAYAARSGPIRRCTVRSLPSWNQLRRIRILRS